MKGKAQVASSASGEEEGTISNAEVSFLLPFRFCADYLLSSIPSTYLLGWRCAAAPAKEIGGGDRRSLKVYANQNGEEEGNLGV